MKYLPDKLAKEYTTWLVSKNNPKYSGQKYDQYDYYLNRLIEKAVELKLIDETKISVTDVTWLANFQKVYEASPPLKDADKTSIGHYAGIASLKRFIDYIKFSAGGVTATDDGGDEYMENERELNLILYGPPGTGKTYNTVIKAVEIIDGTAPTDYSEALKRYRELVEEGRIAFTTFHQSYGYEEFIEGIKPITGKGEVKYEVQSGIFKEFCENAKKRLKSEKSGSGALLNGLDLIRPNATVWKISLDGAGHKGGAFHDSCLKDGYIRVGWDSDEDLSLVTEPGKDSARRFMDEMKIGDIVLSCYSKNAIDAIGVITGDYEWHDDEPDLKRFRKVKWLKIWDGATKFNILADNSGNVLIQTTVYKLWRISVERVKQILSAEPQEVTETAIGDEQTEEAFVFIIDEINRGNVSKIFGELITLIEPSKRLGADEAMKCTLPYSNEKFGVPKNVYILGTMNTADRSLVQLDAALRRRFAFEEMMPNSDLLERTSDGVDLNKLLAEINLRITCLLDREHQIGHSYFMGVNDVNRLAYVFKQKILPLLQEYFFDDYESIQRVLSEDFIEERDNPFENGKKIYGIRKDKLNDVKSYQKIYGGIAEADESGDETTESE